MLKCSNYNIVSTSENSVLLYNTKTGFFASVKEINSDVILNGLEKPDEIQDEEIRRNLLSGGFILPIEKDEFEEIKTYSLNSINNVNNMKLTILPTESCNFNCPYCFIYNKRGLSTSKNVYNAILKLIEKSATDNFSLKISWFGGEPTLEKKAIINFSKRLNKLSKEKGFQSLKYEMITNGYLLSLEDFISYYELGVKSYQITLDGFGSDHNETRFLDNGDGTFDVIWENMKKIKDLKGDFEIIVRHNFLKNRYENSRKLLAEFITEFGNDSRFSIYFRPVYNYSQKDNEIAKISNDICGQKEGLFLQLDLDNRFLKQKKKSANNILNLPLPMPTPSWCDSERNFFVIGADGKIFKCDSYIDENDKHVGHLLDSGEIKYNNRLKLWDHKEFFEDKANSKCFKCKMLPICQGGCSRQRVEGNSTCFWTESIIKQVMIEHHKKASLQKETNN
ncbi:radical SAM protein [Candidatus Cloacimonadota bacterium]